MKSQFDFKGVTSALPTPFLDGKVDFESLTRTVEYQLQNGINGFVVNGTTAESPTLTEDEVGEIYRCVREISGSRVPIILGTGSNSTADTVENTRRAEKLGADAALVVVPYYNKPPQRGLTAHFKEVARNTSLPVILYNVPGRTITSMTVETVAELAATENIVAIKEASGDMAFDEKLKAQVPPGFLLLSGDDPTYLSFLRLGGGGVISVMSNLITAECARWTTLANAGQWAEAEADFLRYRQLISLMYVEANPIPLKWMLYRKGIFRSPEMRLPLVALDPRHEEALAAEMRTVRVV